jgi:predicted acylesterase/phospholipase RssA
MKPELRDRKIGLALGGGAVLGAAHIGVLKALPVPVQER